MKTAERGENGSLKPMVPKLGSAARCQGSVKKFTTKYKILLLGEKY